MEDKIANKILIDTVKDYNSICDKYSSVREKEWKEFKFLFDNVKKNEKVLDLGCGNGRFYKYLNLADYFGVDPSSKLIDICRKNYPRAKFEVAYGDKLPFDNNFFDKIYSIAVLHHIPSEKLRIDFLRELKRVLKENGQIILTVWNLKEKTDGEKEVFLPWYGSKGTYFYCFNLKELVQLVKESGFDIIKSGEVLVGKKPYSNFYIIANVKKRKNKI